MPAFAPPKTRVRGNTFDVTASPYNAVGDGVTDDRVAIQACVDAALATGKRCKILFPEDFYFMVQDPTGGTHTTTSDGLIKVGVGSGNLLFYGRGSKIILGPNGAGTSIFRCFGYGCQFEELEIDLNGTVPLKTKTNVAIQISGSGPGAVAGRDGCDNKVINCNIYGSRFRDIYNTGTVTYDHVGHPSGNRAVILSSGTWPLNAASNGRVRLNGLWYTVVTRIDNSVILLSTASGQNPGSDISSPIPYEWRGEEFKNQGRDGIQVLNGYRNKVTGNNLTDIGWSAIRLSGNKNYCGYNNIKDQRGNGIRLNGHDIVTLEENIIDSIYASGRSGILCDAGSAVDASPTNNYDIRERRFVLKNNYVNIDSDGDMEGAGVALKIGSVHNCVVDGGEYIGGPSTNNTAIRIEDCIRKVQFKNGMKCSGNFSQTTVYRGTTSTESSRVSGSFAGASQLKVINNGLVAGKSVFLHNCPISKLNDREFIVLETVGTDDIVIGYISDDTGTVTPLPYSGGGTPITGTQIHTGTHELVIEDCVFERGTHPFNYFMQNIFSPYITIRRNKFEMLEQKSALVKEGVILFDYESDLGIGKLVFTDNWVMMNTDKLCRVLRQTNDDLNASAAVNFLTAGKFVCYGNRIHNKNTGTVLLVNKYETNDSTSSYDDRLIIFDTDGENNNIFYSNGLPTENVLTFTQGQIIRKRNISPGESPGWICTQGGRVGSGATFQAFPVLSQYKFDITISPYSAVGDDSTDNTSGIQAAFNAASVVSSISRRPVVFFPEGIFKVGSGITAGNYSVNLTGSNIHVKGPGTLKLSNGSAADCVLGVTGEYNEIKEISIDGNTTGSPTGRGDCFYLAGNYNTAKGVQCANSKNGSGIDFLIVEPSKHNKLINCISRNAGYNAFDNRADYSTLRDCEAYEWGVHGYNQAGLIREQVTIDGFYAESTKATTHSGLIIDPGPGNYIKQATVSNVRITNVPNSIVFVKVARIHDLVIDRMWVKHTEAISTIKIVEGCRTVKIRDSYFSRAIDFDEGAGVTGSATITNASGFCRFTTTSHGLTVGDVIYVPNGITGHNGVHQVLSVTSNTFDTEVRFAGSDTVNWYQCQGEVILDNVKIGEAGTAHANFKVSGLRTPKFTMRSCELWGCNTKAIAPKNSYPFSAVEFYDIQNNFFEFVRAAAGGNDSYVLIGETNGVDYFTGSRKLKWVNNSYRNRLDGTVEVLLNLDARILATCIDGGRDYIVSIDPTTVSGASYNNVTWQVGDRFWKATPTTGTTPGWICTTAGTLDGASVFTPMPTL